MRRLLRLALFTLLAVGAVGACRREEPPRRVAAGPHALGEIIYQARCALCHGPTAKGDTIMSNGFPDANLTDGRWKYGGSEEQVMMTIRNGVPATPMRGFAQALTPEEIEAVARYVISLNP